MKSILPLVAFIFVLSIVIFISCKKEYSCENCKDNEPPIANAGADQTIALPRDNVLLDGSSSTDPDGTIASYKWTKIAGPVSSNIITHDSIKTIIKTLVEGVYQFELTVTDNGGLSAKDTVQIIVDNTAVNQPPVACIGADQTITLPVNSVTLEGSCSVDPDNNITRYTWTKISGPAAFNIINANAAQTQVTNLAEGVYQFEIKVTDAGGLFSRDTVRITVNPAAISANNCDNSNRPSINVTLSSMGTLSETREGIAVASVGNKILFAGGYMSGSWLPISKVDIYDVSTQLWSVAELSQARSSIATAVIGNKIFFAGGILHGANGSSRVDIYDAATNSWSQAELSIGRGRMAAASAGDKVLFAGGGQNFQYFKNVDIYDVSTNKWSTSSLGNRTPTGTVGMSATAIGNKIYIAGEASDADNWDAGSISSIINIYDVITNTWSVSDLSIPRGYMAGIANGSKIFWAGGMFRQPYDPLTSLVEIRDVNSGLSTFSCLSLPNGDFSAAQKNNQIVFFTSHWDWHSAYFTAPAPAYNRFDILNVNNNTWSIGLLPVSIHGASIISANNTIYVAGGYVNGVLSNKVYKLEF